MPSDRVNILSVSLGRAWRKGVSLTVDPETYHRSELIRNLKETGQPASDGGDGQLGDVRRHGPGDPADCKTADGSAGVDVGEVHGRDCLEDTPHEEEHRRDLEGDTTTKRLERGPRRGGAEERSGLEA